MHVDGDDYLSLKENNKDFLKNAINKLDSSNADILFFDCIHTDGEKEWKEQWFNPPKKKLKNNDEIIKYFYGNGCHTMWCKIYKKSVIDLAYKELKDIVASKPVYSIPSKYEQKRMEIYEYISAGIVEFSAISKNCFWELETFINNEEVANWLNILIDNPSDNDKKYFKSLRAYEDTNHKDKAVYVIQRWFIKNKRRKYYLFNIFNIWTIK